MKPDAWKDIMDAYKVTTRDGSWTGYSAVGGGLSDILGLTPEEFAAAIRALPKKTTIEVPDLDLEAKYEE